MSNPPLSSLAPGVRPFTSNPTANSVPSVSAGRVEWTGGNNGKNYGEVQWSRVNDGSQSAKSHHMGEKHHHMMADAGELGACARVPTDEKHHHHHYHEQKEGTGWGWVIAVFIIIVVIVWILLYAFHPEFVQQRDRHGHPTGIIDHGTALIWAIIIAIIIVLIIGLIRAAVSY